MDDQATNYVEYSYDKKVEKSDKLKRFLYFFFVILIMLALLLLLIKFAGPFIYVTPLILIIGVPLAKFFFRYLQNEYKYTVDRSSFKMELIHGKAKPKLLYEVDVKDMEFAVPYDDINRDKYPERDFDVTAKCAESMDTPDLYILAFKDKNGKRVLMYFNACQKALKIMNYYNKKIVLSSSLRH